MNQSIQHHEIPRYKWIITKINQTFNNLMNEWKDFCHKMNKAKKCILILQK